MAQVEQAGLRKAALLLHALPQTARHEVLSRLERGRRLAVEPLLDELRGLGIPAGHSWVDLSGLTPTAGPRPILWNLTSKQAAGILSAQSSETVAALLRVADWPWRDDLLDGLPADRRRKLHELMQRQRPIPESVAESLLTAFAARVAQTPAPPKHDPAVPRSWFKRVLGA